MKPWKAGVLIAIATVLLAAGIWSSTRTYPDPSLGGPWPPGMGGQIAFGARVVVAPPLEATARQRRPLAEISRHGTKRADLVALLGEPDVVAPVDQAAGWTAFWWNACAPGEPDVAAAHLRVDGLPDGSVTRLTAIGSQVKELESQSPAGP